MTELELTVKPARERDVRQLRVRISREDMENLTKEVKNSLPIIIQTKDKKKRLVTIAQIPFQITPEVDKGEILLDELHRNILWIDVNDKVIVSRIIKRRDLFRLVCRYAFTHPNLDRFTTNLALLLAIFLSSTEILLQLSAHILYSITLSFIFTVIFMLILTYKAFMRA